jgi:cytochrome c1
MLTIARGVGQEDVLHCLRFWAMSLSQVLCKFLSCSWAGDRCACLASCAGSAKWAGAAYLMWLGIKMIATSGTDTRLRKTAIISDWNAVKEGALNSLTNPKSCCSCLLFFSVYRSRRGSCLAAIACSGEYPKAGRNCFPGQSQWHQGHLETGYVNTRLYQMAGTIYRRCHDRPWYPHVV